ncbi:dual specificity protein kinase Ttk [Culex quinquefasciatus]|uniref:dual specificity protein kinase Ttk n=1 Tax=Culex quinquefasciatus TaxID=7176 RepID=UPI0018E2BF3E|nr:dual specificity protein kinase Ttk [Culex quinquefasciatus]
MFQPSKRLSDEADQQLDQPADTSSGKDSSEERSPRYVRATRSFQPKRVSELPPLESESDSDDDNNLNCAILNDSFLLTPSKGIEDMGSVPKAPKATPSEKENVSERTARIRLEDKLVKEADAVQEVAPPKSALKRVPLLERSQFEKQFSIFGQLDAKNPKARDSGISSTASSVLSAQIVEDQDSPKEVAATTEHKAHSSPKECQEISDKNKHLFVTPRDKFGPSQARAASSRLLTSTVTRKSRNTLENEFKSQKILFATPLATGLSRPLVTANDSLSLSLVDTPIKSKDRPLSPIVEQSRPTKRSTDQLFPVTPAPEKRSSPEPVVPPAPPIESVVDGPPASTKQPTTIAINGKDYQVLRKLGSGGSSSVFLAKQVGTGVECALKLVNLEGDASLVEGYLNETKLLAKLQGNENVVALYDYCHIPEAGQLFLVMEKGDCDLHKILQNYRKDIPLYTLMQVWYQMVQCVHYIHEHGVIHLDLKPANFLMVKGRLKLIDFGIASNIAFDSTSIMKFSQAGTFNYISPEALIDTSSENSPAGSQPRIKMSKKSDIWSLGCILYLLLYKRTPFAHIKNIYTKVNVITNPNTTIDYPALPSYYPPMMLEMLKRCLQYDPKTRASTADLLQFPFDMVIPIGAGMAAATTVTTK